MKLFEFLQQMTNGIVYVHSVGSRTMTKTGIVLLVVLFVSLADLEYNIGNQMDGEVLWQSM